MKKYITKPDEWFVEGTEAILIDDYGNNTGLFEGWRLDEFHNDGQGKPSWDGEVCMFEEFDIYETSEIKMEFGKLKITDSMLNNMNECRKIYKD